MERKKLSKESKVEITILITVSAVAKPQNPYLLGFTIPFVTFIFWYTYNSRLIYIFQIQYLIKKLKCNLDSKYSAYYIALYTQYINIVYVAINGFIAC